jgi:hypothetical protein
MSTISPNVTATLREQVAGGVSDPSDGDWDEARRAWNLAVDQRPAVAVLPASVEETAAAIRTARASGLRVAVQGTGHGAAARGGALGDALLVNNARRRGVTIDPETRTARVEAGALWEDVAPAAAAHGLAGLSGSAKDVGVVGYALAGGLGWLGRRYGFAAGSVKAIEAVLANGDVVHADADQHADLFWALRGGGGGFAAVTALELELVPVAAVYAGGLLWPIERARDVFARYFEWAPGQPEDVTSLVRVLHVPDLPFLPEPIRGRSFAGVEAAILRPEDEAASILTPLRELGPALDTFAAIPPSELWTVHGDPEQPVPGLGDHAVLGPLPATAADALLGVCGERETCPLVSVEARQLGGALGREAPGHGALAKLDGDYALYAVGIAPPDAAAAVDEALRAVVTSVAPWSNGRTFLNFAERPGAIEAAFGPDVLARLREVKSAYDPDDVFVANHGVRPA